MKLAISQILIMLERQFMRKSWTQTWKLAASLVLVLIGSVALAAGQVEDDIDQYIESVMTSNEIPGLSLAVVRDGQPFMVKGYGVKRVNATDLVTNDTLFYIGSTTKSFTATLLANLLYNHSSYSLDSRVRDIWSEFYLAEYYRQEAATSRDLLAHRNGVWDCPYGHLLGEILTRDDTVSRARFFNAKEPFRSDAHCYNNLHYIISGVVIELLAGGGRSFEEVMRDEIFIPLGMADTSFMSLLSEDQLSRLATPYMLNWRNGNLGEVDMEFYKHSWIGGPAGEIVSSSKDLVHWLEMLTNDGVSTSGEQVVESEVLRDTWSPHMVSGQEDGEEPLTKTAETYGLGWYTGYYGGYRMLTHTGFLYGYYSRATVYPDQKLGIFTAINGETTMNSEEQIHDYITDLLLFPATSLKTHQKQSPSSSTKVHDVHHHPNRDSKLLDELKRKIDSNRMEPGRALPDYVGTYGSWALGNLTFHIDATTDHLRGLYGDLASADMFYISGDRFIAICEDPLWFFPPVEIVFTRNELGDVETASVPLFLPQDPPIFVRDRTMDEAPPPLTDACQKQH